MRRRSRLWWGAALVTSSAGFIYLLTGPGSFSFGWFGYAASCPGFDTVISGVNPVSVIAGWLPVVWYAGLPGVVGAFLVYWVSVRRGRPLIGRVVSRIQAVALIVVSGMGPLAFMVDMVIDRACLGAWGGLQGVGMFLGWDIAPLLAAFFMLAAVRVPGTGRGGYSAPGKSGAAWRS